MAEIVVDYLDYLVTAPDALDNFVTVERTLSPKESDQAMTIEVVAGTFQFCTGQAVGANSPSHGAGSKIVFSIFRDRPLFFKAAAGGDTFILGF